MVIDYWSWWKWWDVLVKYWLQWSIGNELFNILSLTKMLYLGSYVQKVPEVNVAILLWRYCRRRPHRSLGALEDDLTHEGGNQTTWSFTTYTASPLWRLPLLSRNNWISLIRIIQPGNSYRARGQKRSFEIQFWSYSQWSEAVTMKFVSVESVDIKSTRPPLVLVKGKEKHYIVSENSIHLNQWHLNSSYTLIQIFVWVTRERPIKRQKKKEKTPRWPFRSSLAAGQIEIGYNTPFVLTTSPSFPATLSVAVLMATARALNAASARWWSFSPRRTSTCSVTAAVWLKLWRQWGIICVVKEPIRASLKPNEPTKNGRDDMSMTARASASSNGAWASPKRRMPLRSPRAFAKASPRLRNVSSAVWWSSTVAKIGN